MRNRFDKPYVAMCKSLSEIVGKGPFPGSYVRHAWLFYNGAEEWGFWDALQQAVALHPSCIKTEMRIVEGNRRELWIEVTEALV